MRFWENLDQIWQIGEWYEYKGWKICLWAIFQFFGQKCNFWLLRGQKCKFQKLLHRDFGWVWEFYLSYEYMRQVYGENLETNGWNFKDGPMGKWHMAFFNEIILF